MEKLPGCGARELAQPHGRGLRRNFPPASPSASTSYGLSTAQVDQQIHGFDAHCEYFRAVNSRT